ncbi:MAG: DNA mismatch repair protein MutS [Sandaracinus sp.]
MSENEDRDPRRAHELRRDRHRAEASRLEAVGLRYSAANLLLFGAAFVVGGAGAWNRDLVSGLAGVGLFAAFVVAYVMHGRNVRARDREATRAAIHERHLARMQGVLEGLDTGEGLAPADHAYAGDLDLFGGASLFARLSVAHTEAGRRALAAWLLAPAGADTIVARQRAVAELAEAIDLRADLEGAVLDTGHERLDGTRFLSFVRGPKPILANGALRWATLLLPLATLTLIVLSGVVLPHYSWVPLAIVQGLIAARAERFVGPEIALVVSRARFVESYRTLFQTIEGARVTSPLLGAIQKRLGEGPDRATAELRRLEGWAGLLELRQQGIVYLVVNPILLWDLNVLRHVEAWAERVGPRCATWFEAAGELEALSSLATLAHQDPDAIAPTIAPRGAPLEAKGLRHPLLPPEHRVPNDLALAGESHALLITGSNMAGKSTLLRAVGTSAVLALAGGFVAAETFSLPPVRLRASMRVADSLQRGASYFQAELARLRTVVADADDRDAAPILFLLDELLRGTNAKARHKGARAVLLHLLARGGMGLVATHDIALSELEEELASDPSGMRVTNVHFTDVFEDGEMKFDYRLRPGVVRTSNALRLLKMAGIAVDDDTSL